MTGNHWNYPEEKKGEREPGTYVRPDALYLPVDRQVENHGVVQRDAEDTCFADDDPRAIVSDFLAPTQLAEAAVDRGEKDPEIPAAAEDHAAGDR